MSFSDESNRLKVLLAGFLFFSAIGLHAQETAPTITARQLIFGIENVDAETGNLAEDKVVFSWLSNSTFATAMAMIERFDRHLKN